MSVLCSLKRLQREREKPLRGPVSTLQGNKNEFSAVSLVCGIVTHSSLNYQRSGTLCDLRALWMPVKVFKKMSFACNEIHYYITVHSKDKNLFLLNKQKAHKRIKSRYILMPNPISA